MMRSSPSAIGLPNFDALLIVSVFFLELSRFLNPLAKSLNLTLEGEWLDLILIALFNLCSVLVGAAALQLKVRRCLK